MRYDAPLSTSEPLSGLLAGRPRQPEADVKRVLVPFDLPNFELINSQHPLLASLTDQAYDGVEFVAPRPANPDVRFATEAFRQAAAFADDLSAGGHPQDGDALIKFVESRDLFSQARMDPAVDLAFFHTAPMLLNQLPYVLHFEDLTTLFYPFLTPGATAGVELRKEPVFWYVRAMLESDRCRALFTNLAMTKAAADKAFDSEIIAAKTHHLSAAPYFTPEQEARIEAGLAHKHGKPDVEILFTNSWHQRAGSFFLRGGAELLTAFLMIERKFPNLRLTLRTAWPDELESSTLTTIVRTHPKIRLLPEKLSDDEVVDLFVRADIFFLDAASVHSLSLLRAMYCGATCIISDAPGNEEYANHGESAVVVAGRRTAVYSEDPDTGWLRSDYKPMLNLERNRLAEIAGTIEALCMNAEARRTIGENARLRVKQRNPFAKWRNGFEAILRSALARSAVATAFAWKAFHTLEPLLA
jgi:glycosyltransferase involved in cell wall biosynthesis